MNIKTTMMSAAAGLFAMCGLVAFDQAALADHTYEIRTGFPATHQYGYTTDGSYGGYTTTRMRDVERLADRLDKRTQIAYDRGRISEWQYRRLNRDLHMIRAQLNDFNSRGSVYNQLVDYGRRLSSEIASGPQDNWY